MSVDPDTMACYARMAETYAERISRPEPDTDLLAFMGALPRGDGPVLDWGCGPGNSAAIMMAHEITVEATDASPEMAEIAKNLGIDARVEPFCALEPGPRYRGIWANFALLHATPEEVPGLITTAAETLLPDGVLHLGMKEGEGHARDPLGRYFSYWTAEALDRMTGAAGLQRISLRLGEGNGLDGRIEPFVIHLSRRDG